MTQTFLHLYLAATFHIMPGDYNFIHPHVQIEHNNWSVGAFYNSFNNVSVYAGRTSKLSKRFYIDYGLTTGYKPDVAPFVRGRYELNNRMNLFFFPGYDYKTKDPVVAAGLEFRFY